MSSIESIHPVLRAKWEMIFHHQDVDNDGILTRSDHQIVQDKVMNNPNMTAAKRQDAMLLVKELWEGTLAPGTISITMEEFLLACQRLMDAGTIEEITTKMRTRIFYCIDLDGDERINPREFEIYETAFGQTNMAGIERAFQAIDTNGDGEITLDQYVTAYVRYNIDTTVTIEELPLFGLPM